MNRFVPVAAMLLVAMSVFATDRFSADHDPTSIATTGRIVKIDSRAKTMMVCGSDSVQERNTTPSPEHWQHVGIKLPGIVLPGGVPISLPRTTGTGKPSNTRYEYRVVTTNDTAFQDGVDPIRFEDFKTGETISIHGTLSGSTLTASRLAKWN